MPKMQAPFYPIIYVRGYAGTRDGVDDTTADPFCGFNLGSTVYRAVSDKDQPARKFVFESPLVRLASEFGYLDAYEDGYDIVDKEWATDAQGKPTGRTLGARSVVIYRYYDEASRLLGSGKTPSMETFARGLGDLVLAVRDLACGNPDNEVTPETFKCYLVAHSMGGLVCRAFLQNPALDAGGAHRYIDKFFTYATPHNGIDFGGINVPSWLSAFDINNFDRDKRMPDYLDLVSAFRRHKRADLIPESRLPSSRIFCMVGTNRIDYQTAAGLSRTFVGHGSDGLVRIENATLSGLDTNGAITGECAKAFAFRAHSGYFGIVNSEEAFQNLIRFLFGDVRVDVWLDIEDIRLPEAVQREADAGRKVDALYQVEVLAAPRGKLWNLTRRIAEEDSVACIAQSEWRDRPSIYLSSVFLADRARVNRDSPWLAYSLTLGVRAPDYEVEKKLWMNEHFEGSYLFRNEVVLQMVAPANPQGKWQARYAWQNGGVAAAETDIDLTGLDAGRVAISIPFESMAVGADGGQQAATPGIKGKVRLLVSTWNTPAG